MAGKQRRASRAKFHVYGVVANGIDPQGERGLLKQLDLAEYRIADAKAIRWESGKAGWPALVESWKQTWSEASHALAQLQLKKAA